MLDMGFVDDIRTVLSQAPAERQTVFFSATISKPIQDLIRTFTRNPVNVTVESQALTMPDIEQTYYEVDRRSKLDVLCRLIDLQDIKFGLIFCATKMMVDELTEHLTARGYAADKMHGDMTQAMRERVISKFRKRGLDFLIATDVAARGLDVDDIEVVFNYDLPHDGEDYIHRIGRTGRAGRSGRAITFVSGREIYKMQNIVRFTKGKIRRERIPSEEEVEEKRANSFYDALRKTLEEGPLRPPGRAHRPLAGPRLRRDRYCLGPDSSFQERRSRRTSQGGSPSSATERNRFASGTSRIWPAYSAARAARTAQANRASRAVDRTEGEPGSRRRFARGRNGPPYFGRWA